MNDYMTINASRRLDCRPADAWTVLSDYRRDPEWRRGVTTMTATTNPATAGTETLEVMRFGGRTYRNRGIVDLVDGHRLEWHTVEGAEAHGSRAAEALGDGSTQVDLTVAVRPRGVERLLAPLLRRMLQRNLERDLVRLAGLIASEATDRRAQPVAASPS